MHHGNRKWFNLSISLVVTFVIEWRFGFGMGMVNTRGNANGKSIALVVHYTQISCAPIKSTSSLLLSY